MQPTILIVDDEKHTRDGLRRLLEDDYDVYVAEDIGGAISVAEVNGPDIKAENDFGKTLVSACQSSVNASGRSLTHSFPAHSYTQIRARLG